MLTRVHTRTLAYARAGTQGVPRASVANGVLQHHAGVAAPESRRARDCAPAGRRRRRRRPRQQLRPQPARTPARIHSQQASTASHAAHGAARSPGPPDPRHARSARPGAPQVVSSSRSAPPLPADVPTLRRMYQVRRLVPPRLRAVDPGPSGLAPGDAATAAAAAGSGGEDARDGPAACVAEAVVSALAAASDSGRGAAWAYVSWVTPRVGEAEIEAALRRLRAVRTLGARPSRRTHLSHRAAEVLAPPRRFSALRAEAAAAAAAMHRRCGQAAAAALAGGRGAGGAGAGGEGGGGGEGDDAETWELGYPLADGAAAATLEVRRGGDGG
jgi:hypothetical protein